MTKAKRERGQGQLYLRGDIWWCKYYSHGEAVRVSTGEARENEKKAAKFLRRKLGEVAAGIHPDTRRLSYEDLRAAYYRDYEINGRKSLRRDAEGKPYLDKVVRLDGFFRGWLSAEIDADSVRKFIADQQKQSLSNGSINRSIAALKRMFNLARQDGALRTVPYFPMLKESAPRQGFFEPKQYTALSEAVPDYLRLPLAIGYYTGMRLGEILSLEWNQIDFFANIIALRAGTTKNDEAREVPIVPSLRALLAAQKSRREAGCPYVCFRFDRDGRSAKIKGFRKAWYSACVKAGLGKMVPVVDGAGKPEYAKPRGPRSKAKVKMVYEGAIFHDLRRTGVRNLVRAGVPERVAQMISGHKTRSVFERYNIVSRTDVAEAGKKLAEFLENGHNSGTIEDQKQDANSLIQ